MGRNAVRNSVLEGSHHVLLACDFLKGLRSIFSVQYKVCHTGFNKENIDHTGGVGRIGYPPVEEDSEALETVGF